MKGKVNVTDANYGKRVTETRAAMQAAGLDGLLVANQYNRRFLTGFSPTDGDITESSGMALVTADHLYLITGTFSLISLEHEIEPSGVEVLLTDTQPEYRVIADAIERLGLKRVGFEQDWLSFSRYERIRQALTTPTELVASEDLASGARVSKDAAEAATMRRAAVIADEAFAQLTRELRVGMTERQIAGRLEALMREGGASEPSFPTIVAGGPGGALPHAVPSDRPVREGEPLLIDFGCRYEGYCSDLTRTICLGQPDPKLVEVYAIVRAAQDAGEQALQQGVRRGRDVDAAARAVIVAAGYGKEFMHSLGHGVGMAVHELPYMATPRSNEPAVLARMELTERIVPGAVVTIEPGIYIAGWGGVRLEDIALIGEQGIELLAGRNPEQILSVAV